MECTARHCAEHTSQYWQQWELMLIAVGEIEEPDDWEGHPDIPVSEEELRRLIAEDAR